MKSVHIMPNVGPKADLVTITNAPPGILQDEVVKLPNSPSSGTSLLAEIFKTEKLRSMRPWFRVTFNFLTRKTN